MRTEPQGPPAPAPPDQSAALAAPRRRGAVCRGPQIRQRHSLQLMGQAAGVAAAQAVRERVEPRHIDVTQLQRSLHALDCRLGDDERLRQLGLVP